MIRYLLWYLAAVNLVTFTVYGVDKAKARRGAWRVPEKTLFIITTDGYENASRRYDYETVRKMIEREKEQYGWEFMFIGANIDAVETAREYGIDESRAVNYNADTVGTSIVYEAVESAVNSIRFSND